MSRFYAPLAFLNLIAVIAQFAINGLGSTGPDGTIFVNSTGDISDAFKTELTPAGWTFSIWGVIYTWQALWVVYSLVNICRKGPSGPAYEDPLFLPLSLFVLGILLAGLNIGWLISFDRQEIEVSCAVLIVYSLFYYASLAVSYIALDKASPRLAEQGRAKEIWLTRGLVHNGLAIQATWVTVATMLNIVMVMIYRADPGSSLQTAGTVGLSILAAEILIFVFTDLLLLDRYSRYTITPYIVLVVALAGSIAKNYDEGARNTTYSLVLISICGVLLLVKIILTIYRHLTRSRFRTQYDNTLNGTFKGRLA